MPAPIATIVMASSPIWSGNTAGRLGAKVRRRRRFHIACKLPGVDAFGLIIIVVSVIAVLAAAISYWGSGGIYTGLGRSDLQMERDNASAPATAAEAQEEIRQMLEAKSRRREARGQEPLDVEAELASLTTGSPGPGDPALREEVRQLVIARNERRLRQGKEPLDVEAEIDRQLRELGG